MKYSNGIWSVICRLWNRWFGRHLKAKNVNVSKHETARKRMYYTGIGNIGYRISCRSNQAKRRKMERRAA